MSAVPPSSAAIVNLDDVEGLQTADRDGLLRAAAMAGAQVRATAAALDEGELESAADRRAAPDVDLGCRPRQRGDGWGAARSGLGRFVRRAHRRRLRGAAVDRRRWTC